MTTNSLTLVIRSVSIYPFAVVIERNDAPRSQLHSSAKRGTSWQPFFQALSDRPVEYDNSSFRVAISSHVVGSSTRFEH